MNPEELISSRAADGADRDLGLPRGVRRAHPLKGL